MSARVFKPICFVEMSHTRSSPSDNNRRFPCKDVVKVRRALFEPIDHEETQKFLEQELSKQSVNESEKWEFDFVNERPLITKGRYEWTVVNSSSTPDLQKPRKKQEEFYDTSNLYPQTLDIPKIDGESEKNEETSIVEKMIVDGTPPKDSNKKQSLITDFMQSRKRSEAPTTKKLSKDPQIPTKLPRVSSRLHTTTS